MPQWTAFLLSVPLFSSTSVNDDRQLSDSQQKDLEPNGALPPLAEQVSMERQLNLKTSFSRMIPVNHTLGKVVIVVRKLI